MHGMSTFHHHHIIIIITRPIVHYKPLYYCTMYRVQYLYVG